MPIRSPTLVAALLVPVAGLLVLLAAAGPAQAQGRPTDVDGDDAYAAASVHAVDTPHFRIHWTSTTSDAASAAFVKSVAEVVEEVWATVVDDLGWPAPPPDGGLGDGGPVRAGVAPGDRVDVYLLDLGDAAYGYATADESSLCATCGAPSGYLVLDNDYAGFAPDAEAALRSTAAHEFGHLVQFGVAYDAEAWAYEATAVWLERAVFPRADARTQYLVDFAGLPELPLTDVGAASGGADRSYGAYVWDAWLTARHGPQVVRDAWLAAGRSDHHVLGGYAAALRDRGTLLERELVAFHAATAAWEVSGFPAEPAPYPPVDRAESLSGGAVVDLVLDHTAAHIADIDVDPSPGASAAVVVRGPKFVAGGVALVATDDRGEVLATVDDTLFDGLAAVALRVPPGAARVTVVVVNADIELAEPRRPGSDRARYLHDDVAYRLGVDVDPGPPAKR